MERICCHALLLAKVIPTRKAFNLALPQAATGVLAIPICIVAPHAQEHAQLCNCTLLLISPLCSVSAVQLLAHQPAFHMSIPALYLHASSCSAGLSQPQACFAKQAIAVANLLPCNCLLQSYAVTLMRVG